MTFLRHTKESIFEITQLFLGAQPQWPNRYPAPGYGPPSGDRPWPPPPAGPQGPPPPGPGPAGQWSGDRPMYYGSSGSGAPPGSWGSSKSAMRPPYRPDLRGPVPMGPQRPVSVTKLMVRKAQYSELFWFSF